MKTFTAAISFAMINLISGYAAGATKPQIQCESGPLLKTFWQNCLECLWLFRWQIRGGGECPGQSRAALYFMFFPKNGSYQLVGEGDGKKEYTAAAYQELQQLSDAEIIDLHQQARSQKK